MTITLLGGVGQFEREMTLERQREGVAKAKGKYKVRKPISDDVPEQFVTLVRQGKSKAYVARELKIIQATVYEILSSHT
ncbi:recombinase family protein [Synechocystis sp. B12]|nr:recombinase family protein [Synechocystis sp. B12]